MKDFKTSFNVKQSPEEAFEAINNVGGWWSTGLEGLSTQEGNEFVYRYKDLHYSRHRLTEVIPDKKVVWLITDSSINFVDDKNEWTGTTVVFDIVEQGEHTTVEFTHLGLVPGLACYDACTGGWNTYLKSLQNLITTGKGNPDPVLLTY